MKRIYIEGLGLVDGHFSGVGQYIYGILKGLDEIIDEAKYTQKKPPVIKVIIPFDTISKFRSFGFKHIGYKSFPLSFKVMSALWHRNKLPFIDLWCGKGFYIFPRFVSMPLLYNKSAIVIYDLSYELYRQYSDQGNADFLSNSVKRSIKKVSKVITISDNAAKEIVNFYKLPEHKVVVATPATDPRIFYRRDKQEIDSVKLKYGIKKDYILSLSNLEPRKNLDTLVNAYCSLPKKYLDKTSLLLVGVSGWKTDKLFKKIINKVEEGYDIIRPSLYVHDDDKAAIISGAKLLVYPSHYEGFGMPPLEALACGVPVIVSNNSSLPQVVGKVAQLFSSDDLDELSILLRNSLENIESLTKKTIIDGPAQALNFSWVKSAQIYLDVAKECNS